MLKIKPFFDKSTLIAGIISIVGFSSIAILCMADVLLSVFLNKPILGTYEIVEQLMLCSVFAAFAYAQTHKSHINMTILISHLPRIPCMLSLTLMGLLSTGVSGYLTYAAAIQAQFAFNNGAMTSMLYIPRYPFFIVETVAMAFFTVILLFDSCMTAAAIFSDACERQVRDDYNLDNDVSKMTE